MVVDYMPSRFGRLRAQGFRCCHPASWRVTEPRLARVRYEVARSAAHFTKTIDCDPDRGLTAGTPCRPQSAYAFTAERPFLAAVYGSGALSVSVSGS